MEDKQKKNISKIGAAERKTVNTAIDDIEEGVRDLVQIINFQSKELSMLKNELIRVLVGRTEFDQTEHTTNSGTAWKKD